MASLRIKNLQREAERPGILAGDLAEHEFAILHGRNHCAGLDAAPGLHAGHIAAVAVAPLHESGFDGLIRQGVQLA